MLSIEITRECPLSCPGCYAYGDSHLAGGKLLRDLSDFRGTALVAGVLNLVRKHRPMHVSLVGGEPLVRHRELSEILPALSAMNVFSLVVTSGVIPVPMEWMKLRRLRVAVSIDGLPEHHDVRREPATYERILQNLQGREFNPHWVISGPMLQRPGYLEEYVSFWSAQPGVNRIWVSLYTPQIGERSPEMLTPESRAVVAAELPRLAKKFPKLLVNPGVSHRLFSIPPAVRPIAYSRRCPPITPPIWGRASNLVSSAAPRIALNVVVASAAACIGFAAKKLLARSASAISWRLPLPSARL
jgi:MoaA/NifB/PqqE/SkfB family radical SAM enzyme